MSYISTNLNFLMTAVKKVANSLSRDFSEIEQLQSSLRGHQEFAKAAYERVSKGLRAELQKSRPNYAVVIGAEDVPVKAPYFLVSPLDGLLNFMHGIPYFAVSLAVVENDVVTAAVIYNPATSDMYFAEKGKGTFKEGYRNHERLRVSSRKEVVDALIGAKDTALQYSAAGIRANGCLSLDLVYVASGKLDAVVSTENTPDMIAAGMLLVKEAGGSVYELNQKDIRSEDLASVLASGNIIAANAILGPKVHKLLNK